MFGSDPSLTRPSASPSHITLEPTLNSRVRLAQYAQLPLGAIAEDWAVGTADALFGRSLRAAGHLLWMEVLRPA